MVSAFAFRASRCFRKEFSRVVLAFSALIASAFIDFCFGHCAPFAFPTDGIIGEPRTGCSVMGPTMGRTPTTTGPTARDSGASESVLVRINIEGWRALKVLAVEKEATLNALAVEPSMI